MILPWQCPPSDPYFSTTAAKETTILALMNIPKLFPVLSGNWEQKAMQGFR